MEDITDADYTHGKRAYKDFKIRNLGDYHDLYLQSNTLLRTFEICVLKHMSEILLIFFRTRINMANSFKNNQNKVRSFN